MATILLSAAGAALGGAVGGGALGLSSVVIGRAIGATIGRAIDQSLMGGGSETVETGKLDRMRIMGASEGGSVPRVFGRVRVPGNVIWTSNYRERVTQQETSGGKGAPSGPTVRNYSYSISLAVALCEGEISRVGRVWVDGQIVPRSDLNLRVYTGAEDQQPDPVMVSIEGVDNVPAYRGTAYVVMEDLQLEQWGNRVPQFTFEVIRPAQPAHLDAPASLADVVQGVAMLPGSGEYALATTPVYRSGATGQGRVANQNTEEGRTDILGSLEALQDELPNCGATSLIVSWFGDDLRAGHCSCQPKVETGGNAPAALGSTPVYSDTGNGPLPWNPEAGSDDRTPWQVGGLSRGQAAEVGQIDGRPVYGGTPSDASVVEAIEVLRDAGQEVMFYPFLLMEVLEGNALPDPWTGAASQPALPWRGRITSNVGPGQVGSTDGTAAAEAEVAAFMGNAVPSDFAISGKRVIYTGPAEFSYRRFILHYAALCAAAGGVGSFCIGSEMRGLTQIRDAAGGFPAVAALRALAADVKLLLPGAKIGYAADWSEYFGYQPQDGSGDVLFHLDPLWADDAIDFVGIDNYMPLSDWRDGDSHADAGFRTLYDPEYLKGNIAGGEGYDWFYASPEDRALQLRSPISDGAYGEDWVYRYKDIQGWWSNAHHDRIGGVRSETPSDWVPGSKPIWFTELGCAAIDKGSNEPNKFVDAKSSESALPHFSSGARDDYIQHQFLRAYSEFYAEAENNPVSEVYGGPMVDMSKTHVWAWDARPWPDFPNNRAVWSDGENYLTGHWITGRSSNQSLAAVVAELCERAGVTEYDVSALHGVVRGYTVADSESPRASLQTLMVTYAIDAIEAGGRLVFRNRSLAESHVVSAEDHVLSDGGEAVVEAIRAPEAEVVGEVRLGYSAGDGAFESRLVSARFPGDMTAQTTHNEVPLSLTRPEASGVVERWLSEARVARESVRVSVPPSRSEIRAGDTVQLLDEDGAGAEYRVDRVEASGARLLEATRIERQLYVPSQSVETTPIPRAFSVPIPITAQFMDLPLLRGDEVPHAPYIAVSANPWPGSAAVYDAVEDAGYALNTLIERPSTIGVTETALIAAQSGRWSHGQPLRVVLQDGVLSSASRTDVLAGRNALAIGDGSSTLWEVLQFAQADLVGPNTYELSELLRGQAGTDGIMPEVWPVGSRFVLLDGGPEQLEHGLAQRDLARHYRVGPGLRPLDDPSYRHYVEAFPGIGLRPYAPAHLRVSSITSGWELSWVRRTRVDGDSWASVEVPLGEDVEAYLIRIAKDGTVLREVTTTQPAWSYPNGLATLDGAVAPFEVHVAQISQSFGPGPFARKNIDA
jgi:hypothetical protein